MIATIITVIALGGVAATTAWGLILIAVDASKHLRLKALLICLYTSLIALAINTYNSGITADEHGTGFAQEALFGLWWPVIGLALYALIIGAQVILQRHLLRRKNVSK